MGANDRHAFVAALAREQGRRLRRFVSSRLRSASSEVPDVVQEVYLRLLRVPEHESIRNPQAYLFTVARHVIYQHKLSGLASPESLDSAACLPELESLVDPDDPSETAEIRQRQDMLDRILRELSAKCRAAFILHRRHGYSLEEVGAQLGISRPMVKKHMAKALAHCHQRLAELVRRDSDGNRQA